MEILSNNLNAVTSRHGDLQCFCKHKESEGKASSDVYRVKVSTEDNASKYTYEDYAICKKWKNDSSKLSGIGALVQATSFLIVLVNFVLRKLFLMIIGWVGENKMTK